MKRLLIYNYWLLIISWCLFLNDLTLLAIVLCLGGCAILIRINRKLNYWRMAFLSVISYVAISFFLSMSNIPYFFPKLYIFLAVVCLDLACTFERMYLFKSKCLKPFLMFMLLSVTVLSLITIILPNNLYTLFTKDSLFIMIGLIFLPSIGTTFFLIAYKDFKKIYIGNRNDLRITLNLK